MNLNLALLNLLVLIFWGEVSAVPPDSLQLVHVLFRHGNRTPDKNSVFPNDLYVNFTYEPFGYGQLTVKGKSTELAIGQYLRKTYGPFIPDQYTPDILYALTTDVQRTKMSMQLVLAGLFPPLLSDVFDASLYWQPIPYDVDSNEGIIQSFYTSSTWTNEYYSYVLSKDAQAIIAGYQTLYAEIGKYCGIDIRTPADISGIYFTLKSEEDYGLQLPTWAANYYPDTLEEAASVAYEFYTATASLKKITSGYLLKKILDDTKDIINGKLSKKQKIFLYSAHEVNIGNMLRTLNVFYRHVPPFGATIFFEIHYIGGVYGLKLYYQDYKADAPKLLTIPGCASFCPLDQLYVLFADVLPGEDDDCTCKRD